MDIATLEAKKTVLVAQRDQLMANFNASLGAIAMCDELLGELYRAAETQKQLDAVAKEMAAEARQKAAAPVEQFVAAADLASAEYAFLDDMPHGALPAPSVESVAKYLSPPEMLTVSKFESCMHCADPSSCASNDVCDWDRQVPCEAVDINPKRSEPRKYKGPL